ncbi:hypothetical protein KI387_014231 [Taxus chinensis]|uniref:Uncharacterized protein n=1 Tax=Taxus chinensis TaxID=29808 RepID=A0AA38FH96_TAXCH|nr:hypothetical protein KI387_043576 [Taxus chinensis]KAH9294055.1 hypothetical protein KI387_040746 [Taxus chinensis]KAH9302648.1 hypothetical protein KI387_014231 [Taxus chinensis]
MGPGGEAESPGGHQTLQPYVVTLPAFRGCLGDGPDAAEAGERPSGRGQTAISERNIDLQATPARPNTREGDPDWESEDP